MRCCVRATPRRCRKNRKGAGRPGHRPRSARRCVGDAALWDVADCERHVERRPRPGIRSSGKCSAQIQTCFSPKPDASCHSLWAHCGIAHGNFQIHGRDVLELKDVSLLIASEAEPRPLLSEVTIQFPQGHFCAIVGPSGCGKSTLLKIIAGLREPTSGSVHWEGRDLAEEEDLHPSDIGYVPQFGIAYDHLTVHESVKPPSASGLRGCREGNGKTRPRSSSRRSDSTGLTTGL